MRILKATNVYGYPSLSPEFRKWASGKVDLAIGIHNIETAKRKHKILIVVSGLVYLEAAGIPVIGWTYTDGCCMWTRSTMPDVDALKPNKVDVSIPKYNNIPTTKQLYDYYVNNVEEGLPKSFLRMQSYLCYNDRVFNSKIKPL
jgi:hypothetical protein